MELRFLPMRWILDERGAHSVEFGLAIALFALIAAFGFFAFGDALTDFFVSVGTEFKNAALKIPGG
jgi:Flp pilus assembly pilin Flp